MKEDRKAVETLARVMTSIAEAVISRAKFDKSSIGVVTAKDGTVYTVKAFGSQYTIESSLSFSVNQRVAVIAPQSNFSKLYMVAI